MKLWILLPAYNEAKNLPPLLDGLARVLGPAGIVYQVVIVDDGSQDGTREVASALAARMPVAVIVHERNQGLARAMETGLRAVTQRAEPGDVVVTMDADNTHPAALVPPMLTAVGAGADVVIASRYAPGGAEEGVPVLRRVLSAGVSLLLRLRFGLADVRDYSSGYRAYRAVLLQRAAERYRSRLIESRGFTVMAELLIKLRVFHPRVVEVPLHLRYDLKGGRSKLRLGRTIRDYLILLLSRSPC